MKNKKIPVPMPAEKNHQMPDTVKMAKIASIVSVVILFLHVIILPLIFYFFYAVFVVGSSGGVGSDTDSIAIFIVALCIIISLFLYVVPGTLFIFVIRGIQKRKKWAKTMGIVLSVIEIFLGGIFGKILGVLIIVGLSDEKSEKWFIH